MPRGAPSPEGPEPARHARVPWADRTERMYRPSGSDHEPGSNGRGANPSERSRRGCSPPSPPADRHAPEPWMDWCVALPGTGERHGRNERADEPGWDTRHAEPPRWGTAQRQGEGRQAKRRADGRATPGQGPAGPERGRLTPSGVPSHRSSDANPRTGSRSDRACLGSAMMHARFSPPRPGAEVAPRCRASDRSAEPAVHPVSAVRWRLAAAFGISLSEPRATRLGRPRRFTFA